MVKLGVVAVAFAIFAVPDFALLPIISMCGMVSSTQRSTCYLFFEIFIQFDGLASSPDWEL